MATAREYRAELLMPSAEGVGVLAVETISGLTPAPAAVRWLSMASRMRSPAGQWWRVTLDPLLDGQRLQELIERSKTAKVTLVKTSPSGTGKKKIVECTLSAPVRDSTQREGLANLFRGIMSKERTPDPKDLLTVVRLKDDVSIKFDDGYMDLNDGVSNTKVGLYDQQEVFVYPISDSEPDQMTWEDAVLSRVRNVLPGLEWE